LAHKAVGSFRKGSFYSLNVTNIKHSHMGQKVVATDVTAFDSAFEM